jgi:hypothetical protein
MWSDKQKAIMQAKIDVRHFTRELIRDVFHATESFLLEDPEELASNLRKKALAVSSLTSHGTSRADFEQQNKDLMLVMAELKEILKLITIATYLKVCSQQTKNRVRESIKKVIGALDNLVLLQQIEK